jgi:hypothetical protein
VASGSDAVKLVISGQVNRALMVVGDGGDTSLLNVDNNASSSRIRAIGEARPIDKVIAGGALEVEFRVNNSFTVSQLDSKSIDDISAFRNRRVEVYFDHEDFGRLWLGQGWTATEFVAEQDATRPGACARLGLSPFSRAHAAASIDQRGLLVSWPESMSCTRTPPGSCRWRRRCASRICRSSCGSSTRAASTLRRRRPWACSTTA